MDDYKITTMTRQQVDMAIEWAAAEGWNPGLYDAECFFHADPGGFLVEMLGDTPVSVISVVRYGSSFGFLGFYIVRPEYRGQGFGIWIWNAGRERLMGRNIDLDGVVDQQDNYKRSGFNYAYRNIRKLKVLTSELASNVEIRINESDEVFLGGFDLDPHTT